MPFLNFHSNKLIYFRLCSAFRTSTVVQVALAQVLSSCFRDRTIFRGQNVFHNRTFWSDVLHLDIKATRCSRPKKQRCHLVLLRHRFHASAPPSQCLANAEFICANFYWPQDTSPLAFATLCCSGYHVASACRLVKY